MKLYVFGACSGTEPLAGWHHTCLAFEVQDRLYFFDAGENGAYAAHLMGVDLLKTKQIIISHPHMDHIGGLGNLLWYIRKLEWCKRRPTEERTIPVYVPTIGCYNGVMMVLKQTEGHFESDFEVPGIEYTDGLVCDDGVMKVIAHHNLHVSPEGEGQWRSYSFEIYAEGKKIVYTGDMKGTEELDSFIENADALLTETGHHSPPAIAAYAQAHGVKQLIYVHNGSGVRGRSEQLQADVAAAFTGAVTFSVDGTVVEL